MTSNVFNMSGKTGERGLGGSMSCSLQLKSDESGIGSGEASNSREPEDPNPGLAIYDLASCSYSKGMRFEGVLGVDSPWKENIEPVPTELPEAAEEDTENEAEGLRLLLFLLVLATLETFL